MKRSTKLLISIVALLVVGKSIRAQEVHAHNDYVQPLPFYAAYNNGAGSIEADIFLHYGKLVVAHHRHEINEVRTLSYMYLDRLDSIARTGTLRNLQLLIDIKSDADSTLRTLLALLKKYPRLTGNRKLMVVISGNRPQPQAYNTFPKYILFDGLPNVVYDEEALKRIPMISDNFRNYSQWAGNGEMPHADSKKLDSLIKKAHQLGKTVRFWNAPDNPDVWRQLMRLEVDWINTDRVAECAAFITRQRNTR